MKQLFHHQGSGIRYLVLRTTSLHLVVEHLRARLLCLGLMDVLHQDALVFEDVTLGLLVQGVVTFVPQSGDPIKQTNEVRCVQVLVDFSTFAVFPQQAAKYPLPPHPLNLGRHPGLGSTLPLTHTCVPTLPLGGEKIASASPRMDNGGLDNYSPILDELLNMRTGVCVANFRLLIGVEPDLTLADVGDRGGEPLLRTEIDHDLEGFSDGWAIFGYQRGVVAEFQRKVLYSLSENTDGLGEPDRVGRRSPGRDKK